MKSLRWPLFCLLGVSLFTEGAWASVLAIDYGSDWMKASLMKPGVPFDVLLNRDSKRKIQSVVGWKRDERLFGGDAVAVSPRFPSDSFFSLKTIQGVPYDSPASQVHGEIFPYLNTIETPRHTHAFSRGNNEEWTTEELIAMQFAYIRELAEAVGGERVHDVIVTVPAYYSQFERQAITDSVAISGMRAIALINDGTAIATNFAMTRTFPKPEYHVIYDAGASGIRATVAYFYTASPEESTSATSTASASKSTVQSKNGDVTHVEVKGFGYDRTATGTELDRRLRDLIRARFEQKHGGREGKTLQRESRALAKLWNQAAKTKAILSANTDTVVSIESFVWDIDFKAKITRTEFEEVCEDLKPKFAQPILGAIASAGLKLEDISSVILTGGVSRTPMVQAAVRAAVGDSKIAQNVNADEAAVLGAAFYGASLSRQFKTKTVKVQDLGSHDVQVSYVADSKVAQRTINTLIFNRASKVGSKKTLTLKRKDDFFVTLGYKDEQLGGVYDAVVTGVADAVANLTSQGAVEPVVKLTVTLTSSGFVEVLDAVAYADIKVESITDKIKGYFAGESSDGQATTESEVTSTESTEEPSPTPETKSVPHTIPLDIEIRPLSIPPLTTEEKTASRQRLISLQSAETARRKKEEARNFLEGYLYRLRDLLDGDDTTTFIQFSKEEERKVMRERMEAAFAWLVEHGDAAETSELWLKRDDLEVLEKPVQHRYKEAEEGPKALSDLQQAMAAGQMFMQSAHENRTIELNEDLPPKYTDEELAAVEKTLKDTAAWLKTNVELQKKKKKNDDPVLLAAEMKARGVRLQDQVMKLLKRKAPKKKPPPPPTTTKSTAEDGSEGDAESGAVPPRDEL